MPLLGADREEDTGVETGKEAAMAEVEQSRELDATAEAVWRLVSDPDRLAEWVPTMAASRPAGQGTVQLQGESHGHDYLTSGRFTLDEAARRLSWDSPRHPGYQGVLTVAGHDGGSTVTVRVSIPDLPPDADEELARGTAEALDRIGRLART
jgi:uncharacterized protein YndB with AHSA1/START domain